MKNNRVLSCGCVPDASGYGWCSKCRAALRKKIWKEMSKKERDYDRHFAPAQSADFDEQGCSCHIDAPCSFCIERSELEDKSGES